MISKTSGKGPWSFEEDNKLLEWVKANGPQKWSLCSETIPGRSGKQCRERWFNNLNPNVKKGNWTAEEDDMIFQGYLQHGSSWSRIAKNLEGRTENSVKNRFYSTVRKLLSDSEKNSGKSSEQQIRNIIEMSLGKKVGGGIPTNPNVQDSEDGQSDSEEDKSHNEGAESSKNIKSSEGAAAHEGESVEEGKKDEETKPKKQGETKKSSKAASENIKSEMEIEQQSIELKKSESEPKIEEGEGFKKSNESDHHQQGGQGNEDDSSSHPMSSSQQLGGIGGVLKRKYNRKRHQDEYSESNLLYRLLKSNDVTIKNTKCLQDYSVFYRKYKQNKYMMKKKKREDDSKKQYSNEEDDDEQMSSSGEMSHHQDMDDEENEHQFQDSSQQFQVSALAANLKKNGKGKGLNKAEQDDKLRTVSKKDEKRKGNHNDADVQDEMQRQMLIFQQAQQQQDNKLKKKLKLNPQVKIEDQDIGQSSTRNKNAKNLSRGKFEYNSDNDDDDNNINKNQNNDIEEEDENNSAEESDQNNEDGRAVMSNLPSENQLDDVGDLESQLLKYFQKSMGQFFKKFIKQNKLSVKDTDKKSSKQKEIKKQPSQQQQQQLLQLQIQEQIQKQLEQLNSQNGMNLKSSKNNNNNNNNNNSNNQQPIQRTNTIIQNPPSSKGSGGSKKNINNATPGLDSSFEKQIQKQLQDLQQNKQEQSLNKDLKSSQETAKINQKQTQQTNAVQSSQPQVTGKGNQAQGQNNFVSSKSSFQLNKNQNTPTARNGYSNQIGSSSSLFSQPNTNNYNIGNAAGGGFGGLLSSHSLQMQQQNNQSITAAQNSSIQNLKSLLSQNMIGNFNSNAQGGAQLNNGDQGVDQKMIFLLNQLNTLESMLTNTKKELVKLEASLINQRNGENFSTSQQGGGGSVRGGYSGNNLQGSSNNLFGSNFYNLQGSIPPTAHVLNTLPSFGSRGGFEKSENGNPPYNKRKNSKDNTSQYSDFGQFINNNN